jgi:hypothetical protein
MLEQKIELLTAAVEALTKAIGGMQAGLPVEAKKTAAPESQPVSYDDVKRATNAVSKISREKAIAGLARFGVSSATKLTEQQWPGYVDYMTKVAAAEIDPEASHE